MTSILAMPQTDREPRGDHEDVEQLYRELYQPLRKFFAARGCGPEESKDLAQETFLRAYRSFDGFRGESRRSTWIFTIATNLWRNRQRDAAAAKRGGEEVALPEGGWEPEADDRPHDNTVEAESKRLLRAAIEELPPQMRRCVYFRVYQERDYREIAEILGIGTAGVKSQVSLARKKLRSKLADHYPELEALLDDR